MEGWPNYYVEILHAEEKLPFDFLWMQSCLQQITIDIACFYLFYYCLIVLFQIYLVIVTAG